jgi:predicted phage terminase large subunit-like protein
VSEFAIKTRLPLPRRGRAMVLTAFHQRTAASVAGPAASARTEAEERERRRQSFRHDLLGFGRYYFGPTPDNPEGGYVRLPPSKMHRELAAEFHRMLASRKVERYAMAAPRGNAKTTWLMILVVFCIVYRLKRFVYYITSVIKPNALDFLLELKDELENNARLLADFPEACGRGPMWHQETIITRNDIRITVLGAGSKIRGRKHHEWRPDLICLDDLESDVHVVSIDQRNAMHKWMLRAVLAARGVASKCDFIVSGTLLHFDSVLARLLDRQKSPGWRSVKYQAVLKWADRGDLWDRWQEVYTNWRLSDEQRMTAADLFFEANRTDMLQGTEVLWPEGEPYYELMKQRIDDGPVSFQSEKQNEPLDPSDCRFQEGWFRWFDEYIDADGQLWFEPEHPNDEALGNAPRTHTERISAADCDLYGACDPSKGRHDRSGDPSALITIAAWPARHLLAFEGRYKRFFVLDGDIAWRNPPKILDRIMDLNRLRHYRRYGIEAVQFQELFADDVREFSLTHPDYPTLNIVKLYPLSDKQLRIESLITYIYSGRMLFSRKLVALYEQLRTNPQHPHDDGPDALELCMETLGEIGFVRIDEGVGEPPVPTTPQEMIKSRLPTVFGREELDRSKRCGGCTGYSPPRPGVDPLGMCHLHHVFVEAEAFSCEAFDPVTPAGGGAGKISIA